MFFGDYDTTETVYIPFNTFSSDDPSASVTVTNLANTDVHIHKDGGLTQRSSASGVTVSVDFDSITGNHLVSIDLSDNTDAGFYASGSTYQVRVEGITVDGATLNVWIGTFSVGRMLRPTTSGRTLDVTATGAAGIDWGNIENTSTVVDLAGTDINLCDTVTTNTDMRGTDSALLASSAPTNFGDLSITVTTGQVTVGTNNDKSGYSITGTKTTLDDLNDVSTAQVNAECDTALTDYDPPTKAEMDSAFTEIKGATWSSTTDTLEALRDRGDSAWITATTVDLNADQSGVTIGTVNALGTQAKLDVNAECDTALTDYDAVVPADLNDPTAATIADAVWDEARADHVAAGSFGEGSASVQGNVTGSIGSLGATAKADVNAECDTALTDYDAVVPADLPTNFSDLSITVTTGQVTVGTNNDKTGYSLTTADKDSIVDKTWDESRGDHTTQGTYGESMDSVISASVNDAGATATSFVTDLTEATNDHYNGRVIVFTSGALDGQATDISDYDGTSKTVTVTALTEAPGNGDTFIIV